ncbi:hypothetical protein M0R04_15495 [Candidatus Dojkabacteria bacterium]|jgi:hypothetical protein|nr:hypothetical protein [Candidatus Dojkabacteria bacterium]
MTQTKRIKTPTQDVCNLCKASGFRQGQKDMKKKINKFISFYLQECLGLPLKKRDNSWTEMVKLQEFINK